MLPGAIILAIASPPGRSARGIVRISGDHAFELVEHHLCDGIERRRGILPVRFELDGRSLPCLIITFVGPRSYTGEDAIELVLPGNPTLLDRIVDALLASAKIRGLEARFAEPGEFTSRAFMNGRISLAAAEGVAATISARCDAQLRAADQLGSGRLASHARTLASDLAEALARVEAGIDFTDQEDVVPIEPAELDRRLRALRDALTKLLDRAIGMEALDAVPWVVLSGPANAGKSTLFNALLGRRRAIVSDIAGTTRDVIAEPMTIETPSGHAEVMLIDLAGTATGAGALDRAMRRRAQDAVDRAELVLECVPVDAETPDRSLRAATIVRTKADRAKVATADVSANTLAVSALTGAGVGELRDAIACALADRTVSLAADAVVLQPRHEAALAQASESLGEAIALLTPHKAARTLPDAELLAAAMRTALDGLALLAGDVTPDDVLGRIFSSFCVGK